MTKAYPLQPCYIISYRPYRETSLLLTLFTKNNGIVRSIARSAKTKRSKTKYYFQPFLPLMIAFSGKTDLLKLTQIEPNGPPCMLSGHFLFSGLYVNELISRLLSAFDPHPRLFSHYVETLYQLNNGGNLEPILRRFEKIFLDEIGFGLPLDTIGSSSQHDWYCFDYQLGFKPTTENHPNKFAKSSLIALTKDDYKSTATLRDCKRLLRNILDHLLGGTALNARSLFQKTSL